MNIKNNKFYTYPPMKMEQTECSETSAYKIQTPGNYPEESIQQLKFFLLNSAVILLFSIIFVFLWYVGLYMSAQNHFQEEYNLSSASEVSYANICV